MSDDGKVNILGRAPDPSQVPAGAAPGAGTRQEKNQTDEELGISSPLATPKGRVFRGLSGDTNPFPKATDISAPTEAPLVKEDPIGTVIAGAGAAKAGAVAARGIGGAIGSAVEGATAAGVPALVESGDPKLAARAALGGAALAPVVHTLPDLPGAIGDKFTAARRAKVPTAVTGGATSKLARNVTGAGDLLRDTAEAHPDLQDAILSGNDQKKYEAVSGKLDELTNASDADVEHIAKAHPNARGGRVPAGPLYSKLQDFAQEAHNAGDESLLDATAKAIDSIQRFEGDTGSISPQQLRGVRNGLAKKVAGAAPLSSVARETGAVKGVLNEALGDLADETPGLDSAKIRERNKQIASLIPVHDFLADKLDRADLEPPKGALGKLADVASKVDVTHPLANVVKPAQALVGAIAPRVEKHLANLAGNTGPAGVAALKAVVLRPTRETLQEAIRVGIPAQVALQVARLGSQPVGAQ